MEKKDHISEFNDLFRYYRPRFICFANRYVRDSAIAEDFTIDAIVYYWENRHRLPEDTNIPAYILTSIKNRCLSHLHQIETQERIKSQIQSDAQWELSTRIARLELCEPNEVFTKEIEDIVKRTLESLPDTTRTIFIDSRFKNKSHKEIAKEYNISTKAVEFHITKAIKLLKINLKDYLPFLLFFLSQN